MFNNTTVLIICNESKLTYCLRFSMGGSILVDILRQTSLEWRLALKVVYVLLATVQFITSISCNLLMIRTLLQKKIRITSCGVYLLLFSLVSLIAMNIFYIRIILTLYFNKELNRNSLIHCRLSMAVSNCTQIICLWSAAFVSVERVLIQCFHFNIYRSRRFSIITSLLLVVLAMAASMTWFIGPQTVPHPIVPTIYLCEFRQLQSNWKLVDEIITSIYIHVVIPWFLHILSILCTLGHIIRHKIILRGAERTEWTRIMWQQLKKHKDFFIPPIVIIICTMPHEILASGYTTQPCVESNTSFYLRLHITFDFLHLLPQTLGFFIYIYSSKVYWPF